MTLTINLIICMKHYMEMKLQNDFYARYFLQLFLRNKTMEECIEEVMPKISVN